MKFGYRGIAYEKQIPSLEITEQEIIGKYRGTPWHSRRLTEPYPDRYFSFSIVDRVQREASPSCQNSISNKKL